MGAGDGVLLDGALDGAGFHVSDAPPLGAREADAGDILQVKWVEPCCLRVTITRTCAFGHMDGHLRTHSQRKGRRNQSLRRNGPVG